jgi:hypothetical protein
LPSTELWGKLNNTMGDSVVPDYVFGPHSIVMSDIVFGSKKKNFGLACDNTR